MKKHLLKATLAIVGLLMSINVFAAGFTDENGLAYTILETTDGSNAVEVTYTNSKGGSYTGDIVVPATVTNEGVTYNVTHIGSKAFYKCTGMTSIVLPEGLKSIGKEAFYGCNAITEVNIPSTVTYIINYAFYNCKKLEAVVIPDGVEVINTYSFYNCIALDSLVIGEGVRQINSSAFKSCEALPSVTIPKSVATIANDAFGSCTSLAEFAVDAENETYCAIDKILYSKDKSTLIMCPTALAGSVTVATGATTIGNGAFSGCKQITSVTVPSTVTTIGEDAFDGCEALTTVNLSEGLLSIGEHAFDNAGITAITVPNSVTSIGDNAFYYCLSLKTVKIGSGVATLGVSPFYRCTALKSIEVDGANANFASVDGVLYSKDNKTLLAYPNKKAATYDILDGVTTIGEYAFCYCTDVTAVTMPNTVTELKKESFSNCSALASLNFSTALVSINEKSFYYCEALKEAKLPEGLIFIGNMAFNKATSLTEVVIPNSVTTLDEKAFQNCSALADVTIGTGVTEIGKSAFYGCKKLTHLFVLPKATPSTGTGAFGSVTNASVVLTIPTELVEEYRAISAWKNLINNKPILEVSADADAKVYFATGLETVKDVKHLVADKTSVIVPSGDPLTISAEFSGIYDVKFNDEVITLNENNAYELEAFEEDATFEVIKYVAPEAVVYTATAGTANPYAYGLKSEIVDGKLNATFALNTDATAVTVNVLDAEGNVVATAAGATTKDEQTVAIDLLSLPYATYTWAVEVAGAEKTGIEHFGNYSFWHPRGVEVDNSMESASFGNVYVTEGQYTSNSAYWSGTGGGLGLYAFDAAFNPIKNEATGKYAFTGGWSLYQRAGTANAADFCRVRVAEDGRIFVTRLNDKGDYILYANNFEELAANNKLNSLFTGLTFDASTYKYTNADGAYMGAGNTGFDIKGSGEDLKLLSISSFSNHWSFVYDGASCDEYALGTAATLPVPTQIAGLTGKYTIAPQSTNVSYDDRGGIWYCQYRGAPTNAQPGLVYIDANGVEKYKDLVSRGGGGIRVSPDGKQIAIASSSANPKQITIYNIMWAADGTPNLFPETVITHGIGTNVNDIAWDLAGNLYAVSNSGELVRGFALPRTEAFTTKAAAKYAFTIDDPTAIEEIEAENAPVEYYNLQGMKVANPEKGIFIKKQGNKATKVVL